MKYSWSKILACATVISIFIGSVTPALSPEQALTTVADRLVDTQISSGDLAGSWPNERYYTGSIVSGLVRAYLITETLSYKAAAESGGTFIIDSTGGNFYGDEVYALTRLSEISADPAINLWRSAVSDFYQAIKEGSLGTVGYINAFADPGLDPSDAVFYLAHLEAAAFYVDAADKAIWREGLIAFLAVIEDGYCGYPVGSLGLATWALAQTGPMDDMRVNPSAISQSYWYQVTLADLPSLLLSHQVTQDQENPGSFYWRFDHTSGGVIQPISGYTEDTIFGTMGLIAATKANPALDYAMAIAHAQDILIWGVGVDGQVYLHIWNKGNSQYVYAGETLQVLPLIGDLNRDDNVDIQDLAAFVGQWLETDCMDYHWCGGADIDHSGKVDLNDFVSITRYWGKI